MRAPGWMAKPRRSSNTPCGRSRNRASLARARPISCPMITPPIAGETTQSIRSRRSLRYALYQRMRQPGRARRVHEQAGALQIMRAMAPRRKPEMPFEQRAAILEFGQNVFGVHGGILPTDQRRGALSCKQQDLRNFLLEPLEAAGNRAYRFACTSPYGGMFRAGDLQVWNGRNARQEWKAVTHGFR